MFVVEITFNSFDYWYITAKYTFIGRLAQLVRALR